jgi:hypothetical protein
MNTGIVPMVDGVSFWHTGVVLQIPIDANGDGIFSQNMLDEGGCGTSAMNFSEGESVADPLSSSNALRIETDSNGELFQFIQCSIGDGIRPTYVQNEDQIILFFGEEMHLTGVLSEDGREIVFEVSKEEAMGYYIGNNDVLNADGSITDYNGNVQLIYTRQ